MRSSDEAGSRTGVNGRRKERAFCAKRAPHDTLHRSPASPNPSSSPNLNCVISRGEVNPTRGRVGPSRTTTHFWLLTRSLRIVVLGRGTSVFVRVGEEERMRGTSLSACFLAPNRPRCKSVAGSVGEDEEESGKPEGGRADGRGKVLFCMFTDRTTAAQNVKAEQRDALYPRKKTRNCEAG